MFHITTTIRGVLEELLAQNSVIISPWIAKNYFKAVGHKIHRGCLHTYCRDHDYQHQVCISVTEILSTELWPLSRGGNRISKALRRSWIVLQARMTDSMGYWRFSVGLPVLQLWVFSRFLAKKWLPEQSSETPGCTLGHYYLLIKIKEDTE